MQRKNLAKAELCLIQLRQENKIDPAEYILARGILYGQLEVLTWQEYIQKLLATRGEQVELP